MISYSTPSRPSLAKLLLVVLITAQILGFVANARAVDQAPAAPASPDARREMRRALREFDRFLDHHPLLEDQLRLNPTLTGNTAFLKKKSELHEFLRANPNVVEGLKIYPRYFFNRALIRQANAPVSFKELAPFKDLFQQQPMLLQELTENPELIRDPEFLQSHAALRDFFLEHPTLAQVFQPTTNPSESK